jgi:uncharacterized protein (TIGR02001 family)
MKTLRPRSFKMKSPLGLISLVAVLVGSAAQGQEVNPITGNEVQGMPVPDPQSRELQFSYGVGLTTNYISKGLTQTDDEPAIQPYLEIGYGIGYIGFWASNASFDGVYDNELDVSIGARPEFGKLSLDVGFVQYFYQKDDTDYGEAYLFGKYALSDETTLKFQYYHEVYANKDWLYLGAGYSGLPWGLTLSGGAGTDFGTNDFSENLVAADIGLSKDLGDHATFDLRANYSSIEGDRLIASLSFFN